MIDLDALAIDLQDAGYKVRDFQSRIDGSGIEVYPPQSDRISAVVKTNGNVNLWLHRDDWSLADIIRRHLTEATTP